MNPDPCLLYSKMGLQSWVGPTPGGLYVQIDPAPALQDEPREKACKQSVFLNLPLNGNVKGASILDDHRKPCFQGQLDPSLDLTVIDQDERYIPLKGVEAPRPV